MLNQKCDSRYVSLGLKSHTYTSADLERCHQDVDSYHTSAHSFTTAFTEIHIENCLQRVLYHDVYMAWGFLCDQTYLEYHATAWNQAAQQGRRGTAVRAAVQAYLIRSCHADISCMLHSSICCQDWHMSTRWCS